MTIKNNRRVTFFWTSYSDLLTSLFFIMLVLFVLTVAILNDRAKANEEAIRKINQVVTALQDLDTNYFAYDEKSMRYRLNMDITFPPDSDNIRGATSVMQRNSLKMAGQILYQLMDSVTKANPDINYLLIIEGNTQRARINGSAWNYQVIPDNGYKLSFRRALALNNFWKTEGIEFNRINNCEVLICGSGYLGKSRAPMLDSLNDNPMNRKFSIQITPKIGKIKPT